MPRRRRKRGVRQQPPAAPSRSATTTPSPPRRPRPRPPPPPAQGATAASQAESRVVPPPRLRDAAAAAAAATTKASANYKADAGSAAPSSSTTTSTDSVVSPPCPPSQSGIATCTLTSAANNLQVAVVDYDVDDVDGVVVGDNASDVGEEEEEEDALDTDVGGNLAEFWEPTPFDAATLLNTTDFVLQNAVFIPPEFVPSKTSTGSDARLEGSLLEHSYFMGLLTAWQYGKLPCPPNSIPSVCIQGRVLGDIDSVLRIPEGKSVQWDSLFPSLKYVTWSYIGGETTRNPPPPTNIDGPTCVIIETKFTSPRSYINQFWQKKGFCFKTWCEMKKVKNVIVVLLYNGTEPQEDFTPTKFFTEHDPVFQFWSSVSTYGVWSPSNNIGDMALALSTGEGAARLSEALEKESEARLWLSTERQTVQELLREKELTQAAAQALIEKYKSHIEEIENNHKKELQDLRGKYKAKMAKERSERNKCIHEIEELQQSARQQHRKAENQKKKAKRKTAAEIDKAKKAAAEREAEKDLVISALKEEVKNLLIAGPPTNNVSEANNSTTPTQTNTPQDGTIQTEFTDFVPVIPILLSMYHTEKKVREVLRSLQKYMKGYPMDWEESQPPVHQPSAQDSEYLTDFLFQRLYEALPKEDLLAFIQQCQWNIPQILSRIWWSDQ
ncbi:hypothetical protein Pelo_18208 [Pelomyxa schiedti]|nr:hypothetical protein Pelo_18208 [Pelomyxa schiedti]